MLVELHPIHRPALNVNYGGGGVQGALNCVLVPSPHPYPRLLDKRWVGYKEGINFSTHLIYQAGEIRLKT